MPAATSAPLTLGPIEVRPADGTAAVHGRTLSLTPTELAVLEQLTRRLDRVVGRQELYEAAWGRQLRSEDRSIDVYISRLRAKLARALPGWRIIHTHVGIGYRAWPEPPEGAVAAEDGLRAAPLAAVVARARSGRRDAEPSAPSAVG